MATFMVVDEKALGQRSKSEFDFKVHSLELSLDEGEAKVNTK